MTLTSWVGMGSGTFESVQPHARATGEHAVSHGAPRIQMSKRQACFGPAPAKREIFESTIFFLFFFLEGVH